LNLGQAVVTAGLLRQTMLSVPLARQIALENWNRRLCWLSMHSLIAQAAVPRDRRGRVHVPPLPTDLPERERQRVLESRHRARRESPSP